MFNSTTDPRLHLKADLWLHLRGHLRDYPEILILSMLHPFDSLPSETIEVFHDRFSCAAACFASKDPRTLPGHGWHGGMRRERGWKSPTSGGRRRARTSSDSSRRYATIQGHGHGDNADGLGIQHSAEPAQPSKHAHHDQSVAGAHG